METDDRELVKKYGEIHGDYAKLKIQLENLRNMKGTIEKELFDSHELEYNEKLKQLGPEIERLKESIKARIEEIKPKKMQYQKKIEELDNSINQVTLLYKGNAISKEEYNRKVKPIKQERVEADSNYKSIQSQINFLERGIKKPPEKPHGFGNIPLPSNRGQFSGDFKTGCLALLLIAAVIFIGFPLLAILLGTAKVIAIPLVIILALIIFVAFFGKIISVVRKWWP